MCTAFTMQSQDMENFFGRTMDFSYPIEPKFYIVPKNYVWRNILNMNSYSDHYSFIGIGQKSEGMPVLFDGVNEKGLAAAALYFPGYAQYHTNKNGEKKALVSSLDFLHYILGTCGSVNELELEVKHIVLVGVPDPVTHTVAPLHWIAADKSGKCIVIESTEDGVKVYPNKIGVLANSPGFQWQMINLNNYMGVSTHQKNEAEWSDVVLKPFGQAGGTSGLPGGYTSPERFVRTAFLKTHAEVPKDAAETIVACFHLMESVTIPKGIVITERNTYDYTKYTAFVSTKTCEYYYKTYENSEIRRVGLWDNYGKLGSKLACVGDLER